MRPAAETRRHVPNRIRNIARAYAQRTEEHLVHTRHGYERIRFPESGELGLHVEIHLFASKEISTRAMAVHNRLAAC